ncbi:zinc/cadmium/mercury/lead-transporting ATPase [Vibrio agarivorans]|uniref:zinc/cadmium/mercury/lead-transporting ATPase n=1 Tax=Vibrio agarivorans TaxID=153622 RepID=UPI002232713E|nr:zinc/cadmium/mercury/lead-transporting ATPase [Vibrio agarivorans]
MCIKSQRCQSLKSCRTELSSAEPADSHTYRAPEYATKHTWLVSKMDCPSCAQKLEKAINNIDGVIKAKVLFVSEKLVVELEKNTLSSVVEQVSKQTGFPLTLADKPKQKPRPKTWKGTIKSSANILSISGSIAIGAMVSNFAPEASYWIYTFTCLLGLYPVSKKAFQLAKNGTTFAIEMLISVAALGALYLGETLEAAMVLLLFLIGERLEAYAASRARSGVQALMDLVPETATLLVNGERVITAAEQLQPDNIIEVSPGDRIPADGELLSQSASFDESALTGESIPVERNRGANIMAGTVVVDKVVEIRVTSRQGENAIDRILHLIEEAESRKAPLERFLDKFSRWYTPLMMLMSLMVIITPPLLFGQQWEVWVYRGLALLLIACPCALVISTPAAITSGLASAAKRGALIKGGAALELLGRIDSVAFDKTGTLTEGKPQVTDIVSKKIPQKELIALAAAVEVGSSHPLALSLVSKAQDSGIEIPKAQEKTTLVGIGVSGMVDNQKVEVMAPSKCTYMLTNSESTQVEELELQGKTVVIVAIAGRVVGLIAWQDTIREEAENTVAILKGMGIRSTMLTGDNPRSAKAIADELGMSFKASLMPSDKVTYVEQLAQQNTVAMVGDGINDAPAMKASSIGIAMGGGTDVALETADAALAHNRLVELPAMIELSRATLNNIRQNIAFALGLKGIFLVTSLFGITGLWVAVLADSGATALVTLNALRLLRFKSKFT